MFSQKPAPNVLRMHSNFQQHTMFLLKDFKKLDYDQQLKNAERNFNNEIIKYDKEYHEKKKDLDDDFVDVWINKAPIRKEMKEMVEKRKEVRKKEAKEVKTEKFLAAYDKFTAKKHEIKDLYRAPPIK